jgi:hypothetical protein
MSKYKLFLGLFVFVFLVGCSSDENVRLESDLQINFKSYFGSELLVLGEEYNYLNYKVKFDKFKYVLTNIELIDERNEVVQLTDVELIDFKNSSSADIAAEGITFDFENIPAGNYKAIRFDFGLNEDYLGLTPADFISDHILAQSELYWASWGNYIIAKLEARFDGDNDGNFSDATFQYHLGGDTAFRTVEKPLDLVLVGDGNTIVELTTNVRDIVKLADGSPIDPAEYSQTHSSDNIWLIDVLLDNIESEFIEN